MVNEIDMGSGRTRKLAGLTLLVVTLALLVVAVAAFLLDMLVQAASYRGDEELAQVDTKIHYLQLARNIPLPHQSTLYEREGDLWLRRASLKPEMAPDSVQQALRAYRDATGVQDGSAILWAKLALAKTQAAQFDDEFYAAYDKASRYGGYEIDTSHVIVWIGLRYIQALRPTALLQTRESLRRIYAIKPGYAINLANQVMGGQHVACIWTRDMAPQLPDCRRELRNYPQSQP